MPILFRSVYSTVRRTTNAPKVYSAACESRNWSAKERKNLCHQSEQMVWQTGTSHEHPSWKLVIIVTQCSARCNNQRNDNKHSQKEKQTRRALLWLLLWFISVVVCRHFSFAWMKQRFLRCTAEYVFVPWNTENREEWRKKRTKVLYVPYKMP